MENYGLSKHDKFPRRATGQLRTIAILSILRLVWLVEPLRLASITVVGWRPLSNGRWTRRPALSDTCIRPALHCAQTLHCVAQGAISVYPYRC